MELQSFTRKQLYALVWKEPIQIIAPRFGLSDRGLGKLCERHAIPTPPRGYWARRQAGQKVPRIPLLDVDDPQMPDTHAIARYRPPGKASESDAADPLIAFWREQREEIGVIPVPKTLARPHAVVAAWLHADQRQMALQRQWGGSAYAALRLSSLERRRLRILSSLYKALDARGIHVECLAGRAVELRHSSDKVTFELKEYIQQKRRLLTDEERAGLIRDMKYRQERVPSGFLRGRLDSYLPDSIPTHWTESAEQPFEEMLGDIVASVLAGLANAKARREKWQEAEQRRREAEEAARQREETAAAERKRQKLLRADARNWRRAHDLRLYVTAVIGAFERGVLSAAPAEVEAWKAWALAHAAELDPIVAGRAIEGHGACPPQSRS